MDESSRKMKYVCLYDSDSVHLVVSIPAAQTVQSFCIVNKNVWKLKLSSLIFTKQIRWLMIKCYQSVNLLSIHLYYNLVLSGLFDTSFQKSNEHMNKNTNDHLCHSVLHQDLLMFYQKILVLCQIKILVTLTSFNSTTNCLLLKWKWFDIYVYVNIYF